MQQNHSISSHVLNLENGQPAGGFRIRLLHEANGQMTLVNEDDTNDDGRIPDLLGRPLEAGRYQVVFDVAGYFTRLGGEAAFMDEVAITVNVTDTTRHYHVPLLVTRYACSSYRGS